MAETEVFRDGVAYKDFPFVSTPANTKRTETVAIASYPSLSFETDTSAYRKLLYADDVTGLWADDNDVLLLRATDLDNPVFSTVVDVRDLYTAEAITYEGQLVKAFFVHEGFCFMSTGTNTLTVGNDPVGGHVWRSDVSRLDIDGDDWDLVVTANYGWPIWFGWGQTASNGAEMCFGLYGDDDGTTAANTPRDVYYSADTGVTWSIIHTIDGALNQHVHCVSFGSTTNEIYVSVGDGDNSRVFKLSYTTGDKTSAAQWSAGSNITNYNPVSLFYSDGYVYCGHDQGGADSVILRIKTSDDSIERVYDYPEETGDSTKPYVQPGIGAKVGDVYDIRKHGAYFVGAVSINGHLAVSSDGEHWATGYINNSGVVDEGFINFGGTAGGYLWGTVNFGTQHQIVKMGNVSASLSTATRAELAHTSIFTADQSSNETSLTWGEIGAGSPSITRVLAASEGVEKIQGDYIVKMDALNSGQVSSQFATVFNSETVSLGDHVTCSVWIRAGANWQDDYYVMVEPHDSTLVIDFNDPGNIKPTREWMLVKMTGTVTTAGTGYIRIRFWIKNDAGTSLENSSILYADAASIQVNSGTSFPNTYYEIETQADEYISANLEGLNSSWSAQWSWLPEMSTDAWSGIAEVPIATLHYDDGTYIYLYLDIASKEYKATDGTTIVTTSSTGSIGSIGFIDQVQFLASNGKIEIQSCYDEQTIDTSSLVSGTKLLKIEYNTNDDNSSLGMGLFANFLFLDQAGYRNRYAKSYRKYRARY